MHEGQKNKKIYLCSTLFILSKKIKSNDAHGHRHRAASTAKQCTSLCTFSPDWKRGSHMTTDLNLTLSRSWL